MKPRKLQPLDESIRATVSVPGSKSYTNRALVIAALTDGPVRLEQPLFSDDTAAMTNCLQKLGMTISLEDKCVVVAGNITAIPDVTYTLDAALSGTTIRFLTALASVIPGTQVITGEEGLLKRPIGDLVDALRHLGADIEYLGKDGFPPLKVSSRSLKPGTVPIRGNVSSQFLSAILMVAPLVSGTVTVELTSELISKPYVDMTTDIMRSFGVHVTYKDGVYGVVVGQKYHLDRYAIEGDASSAGYFFAIASLTESSITVRNLPGGSRQADMQFLDILAAMGNKITRDADAVTVQGAGLKAMDINMLDCPDQAMTAAVLAAFADGKTTLSGISSLRVKETERVKAIEQELAKMGVRTESTNDTLAIHGGSPRPATIDTYGDHRLAMAFAVAGARLPGIVINNPRVVSKTFPEFWNVLDSLHTDNIVLIGMRGSGKSTVGRLLAQTLGREFVDLDKLLEEHTEKSIPALVAEYGWDYFREEESKLAQDARCYRNSVIATGGGVILRAENVAALKAHGQLVLLEASLDTMVSRLRNKTDRPALTNAQDLGQELESVLRERREQYLRSADIRVMTDNRQPEEVMREIMRLIKGEQS